ncbi:MAG TPA: PPOX class F420-dependent oxidoreductase [Solirubrobacteraceae bacterium]|nr:PPOX class F420-dependent oxidoreductase [Solirubrobacteraceae bacterium]
MSPVGERLAKLSDRFYDRMRDAGAFTVARSQPTATDFEALRGHKYALLVTFRRSGEAVPTPVWFGLDSAGAMYVRTEGGSGKAKRIRANHRVRVAPSSARGKPCGPLAAGTARVLAPDESEPAERALKSNYGLGRRLYERTLGSGATDAVYLEVVPGEAGFEPDRAAGGMKPDVEPV